MIQRSKLLTSLVAAALASVVVGASAFAYTEKKVEKGATLKGVVTFEGDVAKANQKDTTAKDEEACGKERVKPELLVDAGSKGLADAVVYIKKIEAGKEWSADQKKVVIDQKKCAFEKHVTLVAEGGEIVFKNSDGVLHNISASATINSGFNEGVGAGKEMSKKFAKAEFVNLSCSVHPWMNATVVVMANPYYAVTNEKGEYSLTDIPAGKYTIVVQHQTLKKIEKGMDIELKDAETKDQNFVAKP